MKKHILLLLVVCSCALSKDQTSVLYRGDKLEYYKGILSDIGYSFISVELNFFDSGISYLISANGDDDHTIHVIKLNDGLFDEVVIVNSRKLKFKIQSAIEEVKVDSVLDTVDMTNYLDPILDIFELYNSGGPFRQRFIFTEGDYNNATYKELMDLVGMLLLQAEVKLSASDESERMIWEFPIDTVRLKGYINIIDFSR